MSYQETSEATIRSLARDQVSVKHALIETYLGQPDLAPDHHLPADRLTRGVLMMILWRQRVGMDRRDFFLAHDAVVDPRMWCCHTGFVDRIELCVVHLVEVLAVFVVDHLIPSSKILWTEPLAGVSAIEYHRAVG
jgi:hypothetical protein